MFRVFSKTGIPIIISLIVLLPGSAMAQDARVINGILDLRGIPADENFRTTMNGDWAFCFGRFIEPTAGVRDTATYPDFYARVPAFWTYYKPEGKRLQGFGYATYGCKIILPPGYRKRLAFDIPIFNSSYAFFINGTKYAGNGTPGTSRNTTTPLYDPLFVSYTPVSDTIEVLIHVANFHHRKGGFWLPMKIGTFNAIQTNFSNQWFIYIGITGMLIASFLFFLIFYILDRRKPKLLMFSIVCLGLAIRPFLASPHLITITSFSNWEFMVRGEFLNLFLLLAAGYWLLYYMYPTVWFRRVALIVDVMFLAVLLLVIAAPFYIVAYTDPLIDILAIILLVYAVSMSLRGAVRKNLDDLIYLIAMFSVGVGIIADIFTGKAYSESRQVYVLSVLMIVFIFLQSSLLIKEWVKSTREKEKLHQQLEDMNRTLESRVIDRTKELQQKSDEINEQNKRIALQNKKLSETIHLKNKIFSVVSHDLRSPVVNILYSLNMLKEEEYRDKIDTLANSCIQYSQMVINLLENMLVWGRGQEEMIRYSPGEYDLADIVLTNMSILKESADRKEISLNFTQVGRSKGWFDRDLIDIVIRNLLSNAIKFTPHGGRITIHVKERSGVEEGVIIKICDNGVGISPERQKKLFTGAEIESTPGTDREKGTGIGLKLVHELVTISMGTITVESKQSEGSCFTVNLPGRNQSNIKQV